MKIYFVGGFVRDKLLGIQTELSDKDYVVVGATPEEMLERGFIQVGKQFPVFLHPETKEEYALARIESKKGKGYHGFSFDFNPAVTLTQDLKRRDFTINAIAMDENGKFYDPFLGQKDLQNKLIRHVSKHFLEDPLRVLRAARFAATLGFKIASETEILIKKMIDGGELKTLTKERVLIELDKVLEKKALRPFIKILVEWEIWEPLFLSQPPLLPEHYDEIESKEKKKELLFFLLGEQTTQEYPLPRSIRRTIRHLEKFKKALSINDIFGMLESLKAWSSQGRDFERWLSLCRIIWKRSFEDLLRAREYVLRYSDESSLASYHGAQYGSALKRQRRKLIEKFLTLHQDKN